MTHPPHPEGVPRVPAGRRRMATAGAGLLLVVLCGLCAAWGRAVLDSGAMWPAALVTAAVLPAALGLYSRVRHDLPGRLELRGTVLVGRTPLGEHGVDLARVGAVSVGSDPEAGGIVSLRLTAGGEHLVVPWSGLRALPEEAEVRRLLTDRHRAGALVLPRVLCELWDVPAPREEPPVVPVRRDALDRTISALTTAGSVAAVTAGVLLV